MHNQPGFALGDRYKPLPSKDAEVVDTDPSQLAQGAFRTPNPAKGDIPWSTLPQPKATDGVPFKNLRNGK